MKKKTIISAVASVALAGVMCVGFAACGESASEAASIEGAKVEKAVFEKAFNFTAEDSNYKNFKLEIVSKNIEKAEEQSSDLTRTTTVIHEDEKEYITVATKGTVTGIDDEDMLQYVSEFLTKETYEAKLNEVKEGKAVDVEIDKTIEYYYNGNTLYVQNEESKWVESTDTNVYSSSLTIFARNAGIYEEVVFEDYEYKDEVKGYVKDGSLGRKVFKFVDDKLKAISYDETTDSETNGIKSSYTESLSMVINYGGQSVTLPTIA